MPRSRCHPINRRPAPSTHPRLPVDRLYLQPSDPCLDCSLDLSGRMIQLHEKDQNIRTLPRRDRRRLVVPARHRPQRQRINLLRPRSSLAIHHQLRLQGNRDSPIRRLAGLCTNIRRDKRVVPLAAGDIVEQRSRLSHSVVVERNRVVISALQRPNLRPSTVRILGRE